MLIRPAWTTGILREIPAKNKQTYVQKKPITCVRLLVVNSPPPSRALSSASSSTAAQPSLVVNASGCKRHFHILQRFVPFCLIPLQMHTFRRRQIVIKSRPIAQSPCPAGHTLYEDGEANLWIRQISLGMTELILRCFFFRLFLLAFIRRTWPDRPPPPFRLELTDQTEERALE